MYKPTLYTTIMETTVLIFYFTSANLVSLSFCMQTMVNGYLRQFYEGQYNTDIFIIMSHITIHVNSILINTFPPQRMRLMKQTVRKSSWAYTRNINDRHIHTFRTLLIKLYIDKKKIIVLITF